MDTYQKGRKELVYEIVDDEQMERDDGKTEFLENKVIISAKRSVHQKALWGDGRSRMTLAHESLTVLCITASHVSRNRRRRHH